MRSQLKKARLTLAMASMIVLLLSGCGSAEPESEQVELPPLTPEEDPNKKGHLMNVLDDEQNEALALAINLSGNLCAEVIGALPIASQIMVECTEYRRREPKIIRAILGTWFPRGSEAQCGKGPGAKA